MNKSLDLKGPCLPHCYKKNMLLMMTIILFSIFIGIIIGVNLAFFLKETDINNYEEEN